MKYLCKRCRDTGVDQIYGRVSSEIYGDMDNFCDCAIGREKLATFEAENIDRAIEAKNAKIAHLKKKAMIPARYMSAELGTGNSEIKAIVESYVENFSENKRNGWGLFLWGAIGAGKTHVACYLTNLIIAKYLIPTLFCSFAEIAAQNRIAIEKNESEKGLWEQSRKIELLILDDFGTERVTDWIKENVYLTINARYSNQLPTIITSNQSLEDIAETYPPQISSRIREMCKVISFRGNDRRKANGPKF